MRKSLLLFLLFVLLGFNCYAETTKKDWSPSWVCRYNYRTAPLITDTGLLVVRDTADSSDILIGYNPQTGENSWKTSLNKMKFDSMNLIADSPFIDVLTTVEKKQQNNNNPFGGDMFGSNPFGGGDDNSDEPVYGGVVVNSLTGKVVFSSNNGFENGVISFDYLDRTGELLIYGYNSSDKRTVGLVNCKTGKLLWVNDGLFNDNNNNPFGGMMQDPNADNSKNLLCKSIATYDDGVIFAGKEGVFKLSRADGSKLWQGKLPHRNSMSFEAGDLDPMDFNKLVLSPVEKNNVYMIYNCMMMGYDVQNGSNIWEEAANPVNPVDNIIYTPKGMFLLPSTGTGAMMQSAKIYYLDYKTGKSLWQKPLMNIKGGIFKYTFTPNGLAIAQEDSNGSNKINIVDLDSGTVKSKDFGVDGKISDIQNFAGGLLYITDKEVNLLDSATMSSKLESPIKSNGKGLFTIIEKKKLYSFNPENLKLYSINLKTGTSKIPFSVSKSLLKNNDPIIGFEKIGSVFSFNTITEVINYTTAGKNASYYRFEPARATGMGGFLQGLEAIDSALYNVGDFMKVSNQAPPLSDYSEFNKFAQNASKIGIGSEATVDVDGLAEIEKRSNQTNEAKKYVALSVNYDHYGTRDDQWLSWLDLHNPIGLAIVNRLTGELQTVVYLDTNTNFTLDYLSRALYVTSKNGLLVFAY
jgi:hypothetical protein